MHNLNQVLLAIIIGLLYGIFVQRFVPVRCVGFTVHKHIQPVKYGNVPAGHHICCA